MADIHVDVATAGQPPRRRGFIKPSARWPIGLFIAALVIFAFYYLDTYFRGSIPDPLHDFFKSWLPLQPINEMAWLSPKPSGGSTLSISTGK